MFFSLHTCGLKYRETIFKLSHTILYSYVKRFNIFRGNCSPILRRRPLIDLSSAIRLSHRLKIPRTIKIIGQKENINGHRSVSRTNEKKKKTRSTKDEEVEPETEDQTTRSCSSNREEEEEEVAVDEEEACEDHRWR